MWAGLVLLYREEKQGTHLRHMLEASGTKKTKERPLGSQWGAAQRAPGVLTA